jgi:hypothetical protein
VAEVAAARDLGEEAPARDDDEGKLDRSAAKAARRARISSSLDWVDVVGVLEVAAEAAWAAGDFAVEITVVGAVLRGEVANGPVVPAAALGAKSSFFNRTSSNLDKVLGIT